MRVRRGSPYFFWISSSSSLTSVQRDVFVLQQRTNLARPLPPLGELVLDDQNLEAGQAIELQLEDGVGLLGIQREALDDLLGRVGLAVGLADDLDDLVERVEDLLEALEDVDAPSELLELVLETAGDDLEAELEEPPEHLVQFEALGLARPARSRSEPGTSG